MAYLLNSKLTFFFLILSVSWLSLEARTGEIEEIVVKGTWRQAELKDSDGSVVILDQELLKSQPIKHFEQLSFLIPNLNFAGSDSRPRYFQIRGIGERSGYEGTPNSSVGFIIDDIDFSGQGGIATAFDLEQIEVYRGPQGSRMGANALAGLIYIKSKDPTDVFEGNSEVNFGSYGITSLGLAFGGPVNSNQNFKYRVALRKDQMDGFRKNLYLQRSDTSRKDEFTGRVKFNWEVNDKTDLNFLIMNTDLNDPADVWTIDGSLNTLSDKPGMDSQDTNAYGLKIFHRAKGFELQSLSSYSHSDIIFSYDADWGNPVTNAPYVYDFFSETNRSRKSINQEIRILSRRADFDRGVRHEWVTGIYYLDIKERNDRKDEGIYEDPFSGYQPYVVDFSSASYYDSRNLAAFGHFEYLISTSAKVILGLRWEDWESNYNDSYGESFSPSNQMSGGKISLLKAWHETTNFYLSIGRGYKSGGFNLGLGLQPNSSDENLMYDPEYLINYEVGINTRYPSSKLSLDAVLFYSDRKNQQVLISTQADPNDPNTFSFLTQNAAEGVNYGIEVNLNAALTDYLNIFSFVGFLRTKINRYESRPELEGRDQAHAPRRTYAIGLNWEPRNSIYLSFDMTGKSSFYYSDSHANKSKSYLLSNLVLGYKKEQWNYEFWIRNLFNNYYSVRGFYFGNKPPDFSPALYERQGDPRHMGILVRYDF